MRLTYTLLFFLLFCQNVICQRMIIQDTFYYKSGEMIVGKMFQEENMDKITIYVKTAEGKNKKIRPSKVVSYVRGGTNERYVLLKVPNNLTDKPSFDKTFFRELLKDTNGISVYWADYTQPQLGSGFPIIVPTPIGLYIVGTTYKEVIQNYYYMKKGQLYWVDDGDKKYQRLLQKLAGDCPNIQENVDKKIYSSKDIWKFVRDYNKALTQETCK